tara:strand:+ start:7902 stop:8795 length:894 start_codon:yes stop_codon:yes gene_type:complete
MQNKHIEHIEDSILTGDLSAIDLLYNPTHISVKMDGSPAIVWGTNPANGKFFVGTKAVFNKKKIRIAHSHDEIDQFYDDEVAEILHACFKYLPRTDQVYQGDFIGWGNGTKFAQNTITYVFNEFITQKIIIAPHTFYFDMDEQKDLKEMTAFPLMQMFDHHPKIKWVQPCVDRIKPEGISAPVINRDVVNFLDEKTAKVCKQIINAFIREGKELTEAILAEIFGCKYLANLYILVIEMKEDMIDSLIITDAPRSYINRLEIKQEGFIISNDYGDMIKLVDRETFSAANFNQRKRWAN